MDKFMNENEESKSLLQVYNQLQDDESRRIYEARSLYSLTDNKAFMRQIVRQSVLAQYVRKCIDEQAKGKKLVLFGAGTWGNAITDYLDDIKWDYIVDNNKCGKKLNGYTICSLDDIKDKTECYYVIALLFQYRDVVKQILECGINESSILILGKAAEEKQYFDLPYLKFSDNEVFLDIGSYVGETTEQFAKLVDNKYESIYVMEANKKLACECRDRLSALKNCRIIEKGCWSCTTTLGFKPNGEGSSVVEENNDIIETISIDEMLDGKRATYIKMDIEGSEYEALIGAEHTIKKYKPKLAISVYHKRGDIWQIPMLLLSYNSDYKLYLRTYLFSGNDTVLYAL